MTMMMTTMTISAVQLRRVRPKSQYKRDHTIPHHFTHGDNRKRKMIVKIRNHSMETNI